ncbi:MAG TPA: glycine cleavage system aminomethyltransferase GcvT [Candidatus Latescibacteria bacterium]|nr:glycine cleavage system aminomethyltransferase GcvT [Candidatus Latescibacterota bacterium]
MNTAPRPTPLRAQHQRSGARLVDFAGWELPVQFTGIQAEHRLVREQVGLFDVSHMGRLSLRGAGTEAFLDSLLPYDVQRLSPGRMAYTVMCNDSGGAIDDLAVYCLAPQDYLLVINASRATHDLSWIRDHATRTDAGDVTIVDRTPGEAMIAVQGPEAEALVAATIGPESKELGFFRCLTMTTEQGEWLVSRSGYTGEDGFEIICPAAAARDLWQQLQRGGARPAGLAARDTLRLEAGLCLYGNELSEQITPLEAGLEWTLALDKETDFPGREALRLQRQKGVRRRLLGLRLLTRGIPRAQQSVVDGARPVGEITSGTHSPVLKQGIAMAYVDEAHADCGHRLQVVGRGGGLEAEVVELPFVPSRVKRRRKKGTTQKKGSAT